MVTKALKPLMFFLLFLSLSIGYSQSVVQKYNSLYNRYEYFDDRGNMIGYKTYNSLLKQWEFYGTEENNRKTDFGKYVSPINLELVASTLKDRQARYDKNREIVLNYVVDLGNEIISSYDSYETGEKVAMQFYKKVEDSHLFRDIDFSNTGYTKRAIAHIKSLYHTTTRNPKTSTNNFVTKNELDNSAPSSYIKKCRLKYDSKTFLMSKPEYKSHKISELRKENIIYLIKEKVSENANYDKVYANGYYGYVIGKLLEK